MNMERKMKHQTDAAACPAPVSQLAALDRIGVTVSSCCAIHCLLMPLVFLLLPLGEWEEILGEGVEAWVLVAALFVAGVSLTWGCAVHRRFLAWCVFAAAVGLIIAGRFLASEAWELLFGVAGALMLALSHWVNHRLYRACPECQKGSCGSQP